MRPLCVSHTNKTRTMLSFCSDQLVRSCLVKKMKCKGTGQEQKCLFKAIKALIIEITIQFWEHRWTEKRPTPTSQTFKFLRQQLRSNRTRNRSESRSQSLSRRRAVQPTHLSDTCLRKTTLDKLTLATLWMESSNSQKSPSKDPKSNTSRNEKTCSWKARQMSWMLALVATIPISLRKQMIQSLARCRFHLQVIDLTHKKQSKLET